MRGYGAAVNEAEWLRKPDPDVVAVKAWLEGLAGPDIGHLLHTWS